MSDAKKPNPPFSRFGDLLKSIRRQASESVPETSGAVEIEPEHLEQIEGGYKLPNEDILMLLINHFSLREDEAINLWQLAGYDRGDMTSDDKEKIMHEAVQSKQAMLMVLAMSDHVVYTDGLGIELSDMGVVMKFTQSNATDSAGRPVAVSRVGMSYDQAERVLNELNKALLYKKYSSGPRRLGQ